MICRAIASLSAAALVPLSGHAQSMEANEWKFMSHSAWHQIEREDIVEEDKDVLDLLLAPDTFQKYMFQWMLGTPLNNELSNPNYYRHLGRYIYPGGPADRRSTLGCTDSEGGLLTFRRSVIDETLGHLKDATDWLLEKGFRPNGRRFNMVPDTTYSTLKDEDGNEVDHFRIHPHPGAPQFVNLLTCVSSSALASVRSRPLPQGSNVLSITEPFGTLQTSASRRYVMMHEMTHVAQNNVASSKMFRGQSHFSAKALWEGTADAIAVYFNQTTYGGLNAARNQMKPDRINRELELLRAYNVPLMLTENDTLNPDLATSGQVSNSKGGALLAAIDARMRAVFSYEGRPFYYYLIRRYLGNQPGRFSPLFRSITQEDTKNLYPKLDQFLNRIDGPVLSGLEHVLPQFMAEYGEWWRFTFGSVPETEWLNRAFGGCKPITLTELNNTGLAETDFADFAGGCFDIILQGDLPNRATELELIVATPDGDVENIYMGMVRLNGVQNGNINCFDISQAEATPTAPCLMDHRDTVLSSPLVVGGTGTIPAGPIRQFHVPQMTGAGTDQVLLRVTLTSVPDDLDDVNPISADAFTYQLAVSADSTEVKTADGAVPLQPEEDTPFAIGPTSVAAQGPIAPFTSGNSGFSIFTQNARIVGAPLITLQDDRALESSLFSLVLPSNSQDGGDGAVAFGRYPEPGLDRYLLPDACFDEEPKSIPIVERGETGRIDIGPLYYHPAGSGAPSSSPLISVPNFNKPSTLTVFQNTEASLVYEASVHFCTLELETMQAEWYQDRLQDITKRMLERRAEYTNFGKSYEALKCTPGMRDINAAAESERATLACASGRPEDIFIQSSTAFPALLPYSGFPEIEISVPPLTEKARRYQNLRVARIENMMGLPPSYRDPDDPYVTNPPDWVTAEAPNGAAFGSGVERGGCDCTCEGKSVFDALLNSDTLPGSQQICRLSCGRAWASCP